MGKTNKGNKDDTVVPKVVLTNTQKNIFLSIIKNTNGGLFWRTLLEGTTTVGQKNAVYKDIRGIFKRETGVDLENNNKTRALFQRLKNKEKEKHDKEREEQMKRHQLEMSQYNKACRQTGSGAAPALPGDIDGDEYPEDSEANVQPSELDPIETNFNTLSMPKAAGIQASRQLLSPSSSVNNLPSRPIWSSNTPHPGIRAGMQYLESRSSNSHLFASPSSISSNSPSCSSYPPPPSTVTSRNQSLSSNSPSHPSYPPSSYTSNSGNQSFIDVEMIDSDSLFIVANAGGDVSETVHEVVNATPRSQSSASGSAANAEAQKKKFNKKTDKNTRNTGDVDAATNYYSEMLKMQSRLNKSRMRLIHHKIRTEQLKQTCLQSKLSENLIPLPDMEPLSSGNEQSSDEEET